MATIDTREWGGFHHTVNLFRILNNKKVFKG